MEEDREINAADGESRLGWFVYIYRRPHQGTTQKPQKNLKRSRRQRETTRNTKTWAKPNYEKPKQMNDPITKEMLFKDESPTSKKHKTVLRI